MGEQGLAFGNAGNGVGSWDYSNLFENSDGAGTPTYGNRGNVGNGISLGNYLDEYRNPNNGQASLPGMTTQPKESFSESLGGYADIATAGTGLLNTYLGFRDAGLQEDQMRASLAFQNKANANNAVTTNAQLGANARMAAQAYGNAYGSNDYNKHVAANQKRVDGSAVTV
jgi:hypothetical protein